MTTLALFATTLLAAGAGPGGGTADPPADLLRGPARAVIRFLDAVRLEGPRVEPGGRARAATERDYARAKSLVAPSTLEAMAAHGARGEEHPLAFWREAARGHVLESFQLLGVRRGPEGTVLVAVEERTWRADAPAGRPVRTTSEYLVARVGSAWRVVDRRAGGTFEEEAVRARAAAFDAPLRSARTSGVAARRGVRP